MEWTKLEDFREYSQTIFLMENMLEEVILGREEVVYSLEHMDVYTAGVSAKPEELLESGSIPVYKSGRGGKYTYHGPGQLVIYPILDLKRREKDLSSYVRSLEQVVISSLKQIGIDAFIIQEMVGIWVMHDQRPAKISAIGVRIKKWVTYHGIAININTDLSKFDGIIPCGISDYKVTSVKDLGIEISVTEFEEILKQEFYEVFEL